MQRLGRNYQSIQEQGSAVQRAGASEREGQNERHADTWTGPEQLFGSGAGVIVRPHVHGA
jgi:hypothetical protein